MKLCFRRTFNGPGADFLDCLTLHYKLGALLTHISPSGMRDDVVPLGTSCMSSILSDAQHSGIFITIESLHANHCYRKRARDMTILGIRDGRSIDYDLQ
jgi:hypothetical protein